MMDWQIKSGEKNKKRYISSLEILPGLIRFSNNKRWKDFDEIEMDLFW